MPQHRCRRGFRGFFAVLFALTCAAPALQAQAGRATRLARDAAARRADAGRLVARTLADEAALGTQGASLAAPRSGTVSVVPGAADAAAPPGLSLGIADLLITDLARLRGLRVVERMRTQAMLTELGRSGLDEASRPRTGRLIGAASVVVMEGRVTGRTLNIRARVVSLERSRVDATVSVDGTLDDLYGTQRRMTLSVVRALGIEPSAAERRSILERPSTRVDAFLAWTAAMQAVEDGDAPRSERLLAEAMSMDPGVDAAFDAGVLAASGLASALGGVVPMPGVNGMAGDAPTDEGLATEGNESEFGEAWFEGSGDKKLTLYEMAVPLSTSMSLLRGRLDIATVWSSNRADTPANDVFHASGWTDLHLRYSHVLGRSGLTGSMGAALPTRSVAGVDDDIRRVPIPPDLLPMAMYRRRNAPSVSAGLFFTRNVRAWTWGAAAGGEWTGTFNEQTATLQTVSVAPGLRWRVRADAERAVGAGRLSVGSALMALAPTQRAGLQLKGGERTLVRASYDLPVGPVDVQLGAWALRASPVQSGATQVRAGSSIASFFATGRMHLGAAAFDVGAEVKIWNTMGITAANLFIPQAGVEWSVTRWLQWEAGVDYVSGGFHEPPATVDIPVRGWLLRSGFRVEP